MTASLRPLAPTRRSVLAAGLSAAVLAATGTRRARARSIAEMSGREIFQRVNARDEGLQVTRGLTFELTDRSGVTRVEQAVGYRKYFGAEKRTVIFYEEPTNIRGTGFLTYDYPDPGVDDDQWLYLPALRRVRRISASDRGGYFLGTDFTYEEIKKEQKVELADYAFTAGGTETVDGREARLVEAVPATDEIAEELGYSRVVYRVDPTIWMSRLSDYYDLNGNHLKTIRLRRVETIDGIVTALESTVDNHKSGHATRLTFSEVDYATPVRDSVFSQARLRRGL
jgi:hypothetical protein